MVCGNHHNMRPLKKRPLLPVYCVSLKFQSSKPRHGGVPSVEIVAFLVLESRYSGKHFSKVSIYSGTGKNGNHPAADKPDWNSNNRYRSYCQKGIFSPNCLKCWA